MSIKKPDSPVEESRSFSEIHQGTLPDEPYSSSGIDELLKPWSHVCSALHHNWRIGVSDDCKRQAVSSQPCSNVAVPPTPFGRLQPCCEVHRASPFSVDPIHRSRERWTEETLIRPSTRSASQSTGRRIGCDEINDQSVSSTWTNSSGLIAFRGEPSASDG